MQVRQILSKVMSRFVPDAPRAKCWAPLEPLRRYALNPRVYWEDRHGQIRRRAPKRDKTMSARQWRKLAHAVRMAGRTAGTA